MHAHLVDALRSRGFFVLTVLDSGLIERTDEEQLGFATEQSCVLYTFNTGDFYRLHTRFLREGKEHAGIILAPQQRFSIGEQLRRLLRLRSGVTNSGMRNRVEFLANWC